MESSEGLFPTLYKNAIDSSRKPDVQKPKSKRDRVITRPHPGPRIQVTRVMDHCPSVTKRQLPRKTPETSHMKRTSSCQPAKSARTRKQYDPVKLSAVTKEVINDPLNLPTNPEEILLVKKQLIELQKHYVFLEKYAEAQHVQRLLRSVDSKAQVMESRQGEKQAQKERYVEVRAVLGKILDDWNTNFNAFIETTDAELQALVLQQKDELEALDSSLPDELTPQYRKRSAALLELREKERALAINKRYNAAQRLKEKNDDQEGREVQIQYDKMRQDFLNKRKKLISRHEEQIRVFVDHAESTRARLVKNRNQAIEGHIKRLNMIDERLGEEADDIDSIELTEERMKMVEEIEAAYPMPRLRSDAFTAVRKKRAAQRPKTASVKKPEEVEHAVREPDWQEESPIVFE